MSSKQLPLNYQAASHFIYIFQNIFGRCRLTLMSKLLSGLYCNNGNTSPPPFQALSAFHVFYRVVIYHKAGVRVWHDNCNIFKRKRTINWSSDGCISSRNNSPKPSSTFATASIEEQLNQKHIFMQLRVN